MAVLTLWATYQGAMLGTGPIVTATDGQIVMEELGQFSQSTVTLTVADARSVLAIDTPYTLIEVVQEHVGTICTGYILNPSEQITINDEHTATLTLEPLTVELAWKMTGRGWVAINKLSVIGQRLVQLESSRRWRSDFLGTPAEDIAVSVNLPNPTVLGGYLSVAQQFAQYVRLGRTADGSPARVLEMGQFQAPPTVTLTSANGADADAVAGNDTVRLVASIDRSPNNVEGLYNYVVPFGGGNDDATLVTLERLWRILHDPTYPGWNQQATLFPEYDPNYDIGSPDTNDRVPTLDGHYDYPVWDRASATLYGVKEAPFVDSTITYTDANTANQEYTARALYLSAVANLKQFAHPHHTFTCTAEGRLYPTRAGDLIAVDYQRTAIDESGSVVEMDVQENLIVTKVVRIFQGESPPMDDYTLSNLGRVDRDDTTMAVQQATQIRALQLKQGTGLSRFTDRFSDNVDVLNPIFYQFDLPTEHFKWHKVSVRVDFRPYRGASTTAVNQSGTPVISADVEVLVPTPVALAAASALIGGVPGHQHAFNVGNTGRATPDSTTPYLTALNSGGTGVLFGNGTGSFVVNTSGGIANPALAPTLHGHPVLAAGQTVGHLPAGQRIAVLPVHQHPLDQRIPTGTPVCPLVSMFINEQGIPSNYATNVTRNPDGSFSGSFVIEDISALVELGAGTSIELRFNSGPSVSNPYGVGNLVVTIAAVEELGGPVSAFVVG